LSSMNHIQEGDLARGLRYGCSTRIDGTMLVATNNELFLLGQQNREKFFQQSNINHWAVCRLAHGADIRVVTMSDDKTVAYGCDGLVTATLNLFLCLTVADCFPVYFWSKNKKAKPRTPPRRGARVIGLAHAGWRGVSGNIVGKMVSKINSEFACNPGDLMAAIGPGIRQCHFEVKEDVLNNFFDFPKQIATRNGRTYIALAGILKKQLSASGVLPNNIVDSDECTYCLGEKYFSYRRDKTDPIEAMLAYIGLESRDL